MDKGLIYKYLAMKYNDYYNENDDKLNSKVGKTLTYDELMNGMASNTETES